MIKAFKTFWKDYGTCMKVYSNWLKKHWKGYLVFTGILMSLEGLWFFREDIRDGIEEKVETLKSKKQES
jgi:hypothetical protein